MVSFGRTASNPSNPSNPPEHGLTETALKHLTDAGIGYEVTHDTHAHHDLDTLVARALHAYDGDAYVWQIHQLLHHLGATAVTPGQVEDALRRLGAGRYTDTHRVVRWRA